MSGTVTYRISPDGTKVKVDAEGFTGNKCVEFTKGVIKKLGIEIEGGKKGEFYATCNDCTKIKA